MKTFVKWWLYFMLILVGCAFTWHLGAVNQLYHDCSWIGLFICAFTFFVFGYMTIWCGVKTWRLCSHKGDYYTSHKDQFERLEEIGWFSSDACLTIGMIGTVTGMIIMLQAFAFVDLGNSKSIENLISALGLGMSTALYTTLLGLISSLLLKIQYFNLGQAIDAKEVEDHKLNEKA